MKSEALLEFEVAGKKNVCKKISYLETVLHQEAVGKI